MEDDFRIIFSDEESKVKIECVNSSLIPVVGWIVLLSTRDQFKVKQIVVSYEKKCIIAYGYKIA